MHRSRSGRSSGRRARDGRSRRPGAAPSRARLPLRRGRPRSRASSLAGAASRRRGARRGRGCAPTIDDEREHAEHEQEDARERRFRRSAAAAAGTRPPSPRQRSPRPSRVSALGRRASASRPSSSQRFASRPMPGASAVRPNWSPNSSASAPARRPRPASAPGYSRKLPLRRQRLREVERREVRSSSATNDPRRCRAAPGSARNARPNAPSDASACLSPIRSSATPRLNQRERVLRADADRMPERHGGLLQRGPGRASTTPRSFQAGNMRRVGVDRARGTRRAASLAELRGAAAAQPEVLEEDRVERVRRSARRMAWSAARGSPTLISTSAWLLSRTSGRRYGSPGSTCARSGSRSRAAAYCSQRVRVPAQRAA